MSKYKIAGKFCVWLIAGLFHTLILSQYIDLKISVLLVHALIRSIVFFALSYVLNTVMIYGNFSILSAFQKALNYSVIGVFTVAVWTGLGRLSDFLFLGSETAKIFSELTVIYIPFGLATYVILLQIIIIQQYKYKPETDDFIEEIRVQAGQGSENQNGIAEIDTPARKNEILERIAVKSNSKIHVLSAADIYFLASDGDYVMIHTERSKYLKEQTMKYFESHLPENFVRIHRSYIVNSEKISRVELLEKQTYYLILKNNQRIKMSIAGYRTLKLKLAL